MGAEFRLRAGVVIAFATLAFAAVAAASPKPSMPEIRVSARNAVPACVTPARLMAFLKTRHPNLPARYDEIAGWYRRHGEAYGVRWDYAFFQMALETNFLTYRQGNGRWGDVDPNQNNFAGIGTTGGGVPGDRFPDVGTGVLGQIQHLVAYSGERVADPVAQRTRLRQDDIIEVSLKLKRPVRFSDLAKRWAVDKRYDQSIEWVASKYRAAYCGDRQLVAEGDEGREGLPWAVAGAAAPSPVRAERPKAQRARPPKEDRLAFVKAVPSCEILTADYGGEKTLLIQSGNRDARKFTALSVLDGFEDSMLKNFLRDHAPDGAAVGSFKSKADALAKARELCRAT